MENTGTFDYLSGKLGGFNPDALDTFFYLNNPFALKHWTMNVVELVLCVGALLAFMHAVRIYRRTDNPTNLCYCFVSIGYLFAVEVPLYFPQLTGADPNNLYFLHNEFTAGLIYDRTPLYIVALYPALTYPAYVITERTGIFSQKWGLLFGAISAGFLHHCFYEIFDHFGPQYGWWVWNYSRFNATVGSVPLSSVYTFSFVGAAGLALATRLLIATYVNRRLAAALHLSGLHLVGLCAIASLAVLVPVVFATPDTYYQILLPAPPAPLVEKIVSFSILTLAAFVTIRVFLRMESTTGTNRYPLDFLGFYLIVFAALWIYAIPEYMNATGGITDRGTPIGSLAYVGGCYMLCLLLLYLSQAPVLKKRFARHTEFGVM